MITITNGQITLTVPNSAYRTLYQSSGFHPIEAEESVSAPADTFTAPDENAPEEENLVEETEDFEELSDEAEPEAEEIDLSEIPLGEMDFYQLESYADQLGLDHKGIRSKKELRALIRNNL